MTKEIISRGHREFCTSAHNGAAQTRAKIFTIRVDAMFTTLLDALFTKAFDVIARFYVRACVWRCGRGD